MPRHPEHLHSGSEEARGGPTGQRSWWQQPPTARDPVYDTAMNVIQSAGGNPDDIARARRESDDMVRRHVESQGVWSDPPPRQERAGEYAEGSAPEKGLLRRGLERIGAMRPPVSRVGDNSSTVRTRGGSEVTVHDMEGNSAVDPTVSLKDSDGNAIHSKSFKTHKEAREHADSLRAAATEPVVGASDDALRGRVKERQDEADRKAEWETW